MSYIGRKNKNGNYVYKCDKCGSVFDVEEDGYCSDEGLFECDNDHNICAWCLVGENSYTSKY